MVKSLPSFGNISAIDSLGDSVHENVTLTTSPGTGTDGNEEKDSQTTFFEGSQSQIQETSEDISEQQDQMANGGESEAMEMEEPESGDNEPEQMHCQDSERNQLYEEENEKERSRTSEMEGSDFVLEEDIEEPSDPVEGDTATSRVTEDTNENEVEDKVHQLPLSKIKIIMRTDPDVSLISKDALVAVSIGAELFVAMLAQQSHKLAARSKKKRITMQHLKATIESSETCDFLDGTMPEFGI